MTRFLSSSLYLLLFALIYSALLPDAILAGSTSGSMPWSGPLSRLLDDFKGPTLAAVTLIGLFIGGMRWAFMSDNRGLATAGKAILVVACLSSGVAIFAALGLSASAI